MDAQFSVNWTIAVPIIAALIGSVLSPTFGYLLNNKISAKGISKTRREAINGKWAGAMVQDMGEPRGVMNYPLRLEMKSNRSVVFGVGRVSFQDDEKNLFVDFNLKGSFFSDRFVRIDYVAADGGSTHFGHFLMELSADAKTLRGFFVGYGVESECLVNGNIKLRKV